MTQASRKFRPGMLVEYHDGHGQDTSDGRRGILVRRVGRYAEWLVKITEMPATWPPACITQIGSTTFWWESDFVAVTKGGRCSHEAD